MNKNVAEKCTIKMLRVWVMGLMCLAMSACTANEMEHKYIDNNGVKIHYVAMGKGPLIVFIHGFPDFWYSWHLQMNGLKDDFRVAALDVRGYNKSDKPEKQEDYDMSLLIEDVAAVIKAEGEEKAVIVGHDWGGGIAWRFAMARPQMTDKLIVINIPHPRAYIRELANNPAQYASTQYARDFQEPDSHTKLNIETLAGLVAKDDETRAKYIEAFKNSSLNGMMNHYRQNFPREPYNVESVVDMPNLSMPVLQFHGLKDTFSLDQGLNNTWAWIDKDYTLVTIPNADHWAHHDAPDLVTNTIKWWLKMHQ